MDFSHGRRWDWQGSVTKGAQDVEEAGGTKGDSPVSNAGKQAEDNGIN